MATDLKQKLKAQANAGAAPAAPELTTNAQIQAKIDAYKAANPKYVEYLKTLPRDRLENMAILRRVEGVEQQQRIRQATSNKLETWLSTRPEVASKIADAVAKVAPEKQAGARVNMIRSAIQQEALKGPKV